MLCWLISVFNIDHPLKPKISEKVNSKVIKDYPIQPVPFTDVQLTDHFWKPRIEILHDVTIPHALDELKSTGRVENFRIAAREDTGHFCTEYPFDDTDLYKVIQGISYLLQVHPDKALKARMDSLIDVIAAAQEPDGYLYTARTIDPEHPHAWSGMARWENVEVLSHELYNSGHLFQAAAANYMATGDKKLLNVAIENANLIDQVFGWGKLEKYPGHPEVELGLVSLYRVTGDVKYLNEAKFFLDVRGPGGEVYNQANKKVIDQHTAEGHAVRATYLYSAMTDVSALTGQQAYLNAADNIWNDIVSKKIYITGGIGSTSNGEAFGKAYELPNMTAYNETCASIGNVFFNERMFLTHGESKYYDLLERTMYNSLSSGISLSGDKFFYPNPLESRGQYARSQWFACACCPTNMIRFLPSVPGYIYAHQGDKVYVNLYIADKAKFQVNGKQLQLEQQTNYPWDGKVLLKVNPQQQGNFALHLRIPDWAKGNPIPGNLYTFDQKDSTYTIKVNGKAVNVNLQDGYAVIDRNWKTGDEVALNFQMEIHKVKANPQVDDDNGKFALQRGPMVYCLEWPDNPHKQVLNMVVNPDQKFEASYKPDMLNGVEIIQGKAQAAKRTADNIIQYTSEEMTAIPYYAWANRGAGEMTVWIPDTVSAAKPLPMPTIANTSEIKATHDTKALMALNDQELPKNSDDHSVMYYHWWPIKDTTVSVEYDFDKPHQISSSNVYWYDDSANGGGCKVPDSWRLYYKSNGKWLPVDNQTAYSTQKDQLNEVRFSPVQADALKLEVKLNKNYSTGIYEWGVH